MENNSSFTPINSYSGNPTNPYPGYADLTNISTNVTAGSYTPFSVVVAKQPTIHILQIWEGKGMIDRKKIMISQ